MKIEIIDRKAGSLEDFADEHGLNMDVLRHLSTTKSGFTAKSYTAKFHGVIHSQKCIGFGYSVEDAIADYARKIQGKTIIYYAPGGETKPLIVPYLEYDGGES